MAEFPGYLSENAQRSFPFREPATGAALVLPRDFLLSLRLYLCADQRADVYLSRLAYHAPTDAYTLEFSSAADDAVLLSSSIPRRDGGESRVGVQTVLGSGARLAVFVPGPAWDEFSFLGADSWAVDFDAGAAALEPSASVPGPAAFRQLRVNAESLLEDPDLNVSLSLRAGRGLAFSADDQRPDLPSFFRNSALAPAAIRLEAGSELGESAWPEEAGPLYVSSINGQGAALDGGFRLYAQDCLRAGQPAVDPEEGEPYLLANSLQLSNDCGPCCGCADYRRVARAIARRGAKLQDLCERTRATLEDAVARYQEIAGKINVRRPPLARIENVFAQDNLFYFTARNAVEIPLYLYVALALESSASLPALSLSAPTEYVHYVGQTGGGATFSSLVAADRAGLPPLAATPFDHAWPFPFSGTNNSNAGRVWRVCMRDSAGAIAPVPSGAGVRVSLTIAGPGDPLAIPVAAGLTAALRILSLQGPGLDYPYAAFTKRAALVAGNPYALGGLSGAGYVEAALP
jgi:hypothetical protein